MNFNLELFKEKAKNVLHHSIRIAIIILTFFIGITAHYIYVEMRKPSDVIEVPSHQEVKTLQSTSIAINERDELLIINRADGTYEIYQDSVGRAIFNLYAGKIYASKN
jgi:hypothetical protein